MIMGNNHTDSPSKANQHQETVVRAFFVSFSNSFEAILHSAEAMEVVHPISAKREFVFQIVQQSFRDVEAKMEFEQSDLNEFHDLQKEFFQLWKSLSES